MHRSCARPFPRLTIRIWLTNNCVISRSSRMESAIVKTSEIARDALAKDHCYLESLERFERAGDALLSLLNETLAVFRIYWDARSYDWLHQTCPLGGVNATGRTLDRAKEPSLQSAWLPRRESQWSLLKEAMAVVGEEVSRGDQICARRRQLE